MKRLIEKNIEKWLSNEQNALLITGARQIGKTYIIRKMLRNKNYVEFNFIDQPELIPLFENALSTEDILMKISMFAKKDLVKGETIIFFDEVQECKEIITRIKYLVDDGSYKYILSGSLLGVELKNLRSAPVGYLNTMQMYPMNLIEFYHAIGIKEEVLKLVENAYKEVVPVDAFIHKRLLDAFYLYLIVGGMPRVVKSYIENNDLRMVGQIQENLIHQYKNDFTKYEQNNKLNLVETYDAIPSELEEKNKRFMLSKNGKKVSFDKVKNNFIWLKDAGVALPVYNVTELKTPLKINEKRNLFKLFMSDIGLLTNHYPIQTKIKILNKDKDINNGGLFENVVAQELNAKGFDLYYFNNKKMGEIDLCIELDGDVLPIEIKSGKDYKKHSALSNILNENTYDIKKAYVLCNDNISIHKNVIYLPIYMMSFIENTSIDEWIYTLDVNE